ncbi:DUF4231 domain-containing protein [Streptomyces sp. e14]|uniref:DUF4231 domain-containing protein n=1 Tax=Streptomyces sp. e14 TaxID=645465 RepID=UPI0018CFE2E6|nr:DUF4231 domain-containing protein [Streptomyces sp. e14]
MSENAPANPEADDYAMRLANESYEWYKRAAIRSRKAFRISESAILAISSSIPLSAVFVPNSSTLPAALGAVIVIISGLRSIFYWHDNYLRFSSAREAIEAERRRYKTNAAPYNDPSTKDAILAENVTQIEQGEMNNWMKVALEKPTPNPAQPDGSPLQP